LHKNIVNFPTSLDLVQSTLPRFVTLWLCKRKIRI
jgi:hypothetical protein